MASTAENIYHYIVHGVGVRSNRRLDFLGKTNEPCTAALSIWSGTIDALRARCPDLDWTQLTAAAPGQAKPAPVFMRQWRAQGEVYACHSGDSVHQIVAILSGRGDRIDVGWSNPDSLPEAAFLEIAAIDYFMANLLAVALRLAGQVVLHGNCVQVDGRALIWIGEKGVGKSTLGAAFVAAGYPLLADDQVVVWPVGDGYGVAPGVRRLRLWPESMTALAPASAPVSLQQPFGAAVKGYVTTPADDPTVDLRAMAPLAAIYLLQPRGNDASAHIDTPTLGERLQLLHTHCFGQQHLALSDPQRRAEFRRLGELVRQAPVRLIRLPDRLDALPAAVNTIVSQICDR